MPRASSPRARNAPFDSVEDVWRRSGVPVAALEKLADADAFAAPRPRPAPGVVAGARPRRRAAALVRRRRRARRRARGARSTPLTAGREVVEDYRAVQLTLRDHPLAFVRPELERRGSVPCAALKRIKDGRKVRLSGIVLIRQRPGAGNVTFITIEDESGIANIIIWQRLYEKFRRTILSAAMIGVDRPGPEGRRRHPRHRRPGRGRILPAPRRRRAAISPIAPAPATAPGRRPRPPPRPPRLLPPAESDDAIRIKSRDFH